MSEKVQCCGHEKHQQSPKHHTHDHGHDHSHAHGHSHDHSHGHAHPPATPVKTAPLPGTEQLMLNIVNMDCPTEEALIRQCLTPLPGVAALDFDLLNRVLTVHHSLQDTSGIQTKLASIGMQGVPVVADDGAQAAAQALEQAAATRRKWLVLGFAGVMAVSAEVTAYMTGNETSLAVAALALVAILAGGIPTLKKAWIALRHFTLNIHLLMAVAVIGAAAIGQWPEAAVVIWLFGLAEMIEAASLDRARNAIAGLAAHAPDTALLKQADGSWVETATAQIAVGQLMRVRPGERIALDGVVESGQSSVNQAPITGESMPVAKAAGDKVYAGTLNQAGMLEMRVSSLKNETTLARIARSVQQAQSQRAPTQRFVDKFAAVYTPVVFVIALLVAVLPPLMGSAQWHASIYQALVLLVIACPCALVISTPVTIVCGLALAARRGILVKGGLYLEQGRQLATIALDKTGTLTQGKPALTGIVPLANMTENEVLRIAASLDSLSQHPVAHAIVMAHASQNNGENRPDDVSDFLSLSGRGVRGTIAGKQYHLGNLRMFNELGIILSTAEKDRLEQEMGKLEAQAGTVVLLCDESSVLALLAVADSLRDTSRAAVAQMQALGIRLVMLSGDNRQTALAIGSQLGIADVRAELMPDDKLAAIHELSGSAVTGMVGDGVNDAPALARANIGFAMGAAGTDTALETADVALMQDDLRKLPEFIHISRRTAAILWQNISLALGIKAVFFILTLSGHSSLWMAVFADTGTSLLVVLNSLRMLQHKKIPGLA
ncbi:heavy metal translocating P-type ATPase [Undibacterium sp. TJN25]|uniref:heavy metal translocating P-type ATPase n=1 Tax=Undibacterium sp. TJN25 TaxID=3413056 RepID=UPI003BEFB5FC